MMVCPAIVSTAIHSYAIAQSNFWFHLQVIIQKAHHNSHLHRRRPFELQHPVPHRLHRYRRLFISTTDRAAHRKTTTLRRLTPCRHRKCKIRRRQTTTTQRAAGITRIALVGRKWRTIRRIRMDWTTAVMMQTKQTIMRWQRSGKRCIRRTRIEIVPTKTAASE